MLAFSAFVTQEQMGRSAVDGEARLGCGGVGVSHRCTGLQSVRLFLQGTGPALKVLFLGTSKSTVRAPAPGLSAIRQRAVILFELTALHRLVVC